MSQFASRAKQELAKKVASDQVTLAQANELSELFETRLFADVSNMIDMPQNTLDREKIRDVIESYSSKEYADTIVRMYQYLTTLEGEKNARLIAITEQLKETLWSIWHHQ
jgi:hypothetical protein